jgi:two-component system cell cycle response regulator
MQTKSRLLFIVTFMLLALTAATIINVSLNFRDYSIKSAVEKAEMTATIVKNGLTAHMVNGIMDKREYFLDQISRNDEIESLWLVRSENVIKQYGEGFNNETVRDAIDKKVLDTGKTVQHVEENADKIKLRVSIPYTATHNGSGPDCTSCHDVARGDTLGAISMEFDIGNMRSTGLLTILKILGINLLFIVIALFLINRYVKPYLELFLNMQKGIQKAQVGDFSHEFKSNASGEAKVVVGQMNHLFKSMHETFGDIKSNLTTFVAQGNNSDKDPLYEAKVIIDELSDIYKFKKTIELDADKDSVYKRIVDILLHKFNIEHFAFYQVNHKTSKRSLIYITQDSSICHKFVDKDALECRAHRTNTDVVSTEFLNLCSNCTTNDLHYLCIPFTINSEASLIISITTKTENELTKINAMTPSIKHYLEAAKPVIESRILMDKLRDTSLRDGMTELYNRRFLEEFIDKFVKQAKRIKDSYVVMMLDVDYFKMVNDTYGHDVGDKVIVALANVLKESIRESDLAIRYGGEEFLVLLHNANEEGAMMVAQNIHKAFAELVFEVGVGETLQKTISIGMAKFPSDGDSIWKCIKYADTALYSAKTTGRNKIVEFKADMHKEEDF